MNVNNAKTLETNPARELNSTPAKQTESKFVATTPKVQSDAGTNSKLGELQNRGIQTKQSIVNNFAATAAATVKDISTEATVTKTGVVTTIDAGAGNDKINISQNATTGEVTVDVNGAKKTFSAADSQNLVINAGDGNDNIKVGKGVTVKLTLDGGNGNDTINVDKGVTTGQKIDGGDGNDSINGGSGGDEIKGGNGNDKIKGGAGNDTIEAGDGDDQVDGGDGRDYINGGSGDDKLLGGKGSDTIYGGDGKDNIQGGNGDDYLEGGKGNDTISGGKGNDILSGGIGDDTLKGGDGDDVIYGGQGKDNIFGEKGNNKIFSQTDDTDDSKKKGVNNTVVTVDLSKAIGSNFVINGSDEFKQRMEADLEMLRSSVVGRKMLEGIDGSGKTVTIEQFDVQNGTASSRNGTATFYDPTTSTRGTKDDVTLNINPNFFPADHIPPIGVMFHELAHAYDITNGTLRPDVYNGTDTTDSGRVNIRERVAVGLPIDHDGDPATPEQVEADSIHPKDLTENALRDEMNRARRPHYGAL
jgi:Ca2+-binding RTX toxin-like protein